MSRLSLLSFLLIIASVVSGQQSQTFTTSGTFTVPVGVTSITVECWGGGGAGGGTDANGTRGGGGGAGGAYARKTITVTPGVDYVVTVGGVATAVNGSVVNGNSSWFGTTGTVFAQGGAGGSVPNGGAVSGGLGSSSSSIGDIVFAGGDGAAGSSSESGAGGGGAGSTGDGGDASGTTAGIGTSLNGGNGGAGRSTENNGIAGSPYGGGGSGAYIPDNSNHSGGNGAQGLVVITWNMGIFNSTGSFQVPAGVSSVTVQCWGGGGAGGGNTSGNDGGGGGGGGAYSRSVVTVVPGNSYTVTVGAGGSGGTGNGGNGGNSWFGSDATAMARGGSGGEAPVSGAGGIGGPGGPAASSVGTDKYNGGNGGTGRNSNTGRGGPGGSSAGTASNGVSGPTTWSTLTAQPAPEGGGKGGDGGDDVPTAGVVPGGGGGGAGDNGSGGNGANGCVIVSWESPVFYSQNSGDPAVLANWKTTSGYSPANFTTADQTFVIRNGHELTTTAANWVVSGINTSVIIQSGGTLTETFQISFSVNTAFIIENGGTFNHDVNSVSIFNGAESFGASSTVKYRLSGAQTVAAVTYGNLVLSGSGTKTISSCIVNGMLSMEGEATASTGLPVYGTGATLRYKGSILQNTGSELPAVFNGSGGLVFDNINGVNLAGSCTVSSIITMIQGNIITGSNTLGLSNSSVSALTRTAGSIIGNFRRTVASTSANYIFPVGTAAAYRPAVINFAFIASSTDITAEFIASAPTGFVPYLDDVSNLQALFTEGYWRFTSSSLPAVNYSISLDGSGFTSFPIDEAARLSYCDDGNTTWRTSGSHGTFAGNVLSRTGVTSLSTSSFYFSFADGCIPISMGYEYERTITLDYTKVSGGTDLFNFPVLIRLTAQNFLKSYPTGRIYNTSGYDIIFTDNSYNKLDHQIEYYSGSNGDVIAWVRIPTLSCSANTVIKMLYGNLQVSADQSVTSVWDSHYRGVWHLDDNNLEDFSFYDKSGTPSNSPTYPAGMIRNSLSLNGSDQYATVTGAPNINFAGNITVSAWVYMNAGGLDQKIAGNQNNSSGGFKFGLYTNNKVEFEIRNSANTPSLNRDVTGGTVLNTGQWYYLAGMSSDVLDSIKTFVNGVAERPFKKTGILGIASNDLVIGREPFTGLYYFNGRFDELRISDKVRSDGWLRTEYFNQSSPSTFFSLGVEATSSNLPSESICTGPITLTFGFPAGGVYSGAPGIAGDVFTPPAPGTYTIIYTYPGDCGPTSISKNFIITDRPATPVAANMTYCSDQITYLQATTGENIKWYYSGVLVSTANPFSTGQTVPGTYTYTVTQTVNGCEGDPATVTLTIYNTVSISADPVATTICDGSNASFTVIPAGYNPSFRWQENEVDIVNGGIYSGADSQSLVLTNPTTDKNGKRYRCIVTSTCGSLSVTSNAAVLTVTPIPVATFSYPGSPYCPNSANQLPGFSGGGVPGIFSSTAGLTFANTSTGEINVTSSIPGDYTVTNTIAAAGGCSEVVATSPFSIISELTWAGPGTDWNTAANWLCSKVPDFMVSVRIPDLVSDPILNPGLTASVKNITIESGALFTIAGNTLQLSGTITNAGSIEAAAGSIEMNGTIAQSIPAGLFTGNILNELIINNPDGVILAGPVNVTGRLFLQNGDLASDGNLTLTSTAAGTAYIDGSGTGDVTGNVTMQRYHASPFGYSYFSSPFQGSTVAEFSDEVTLGASFPPIYKYVENRQLYGVEVTGWESYVKPDSLLRPLHGYSVNLPSSPNITVDMTGVVNNGNISLNVYNHNQKYTKGFNLVGNPYPSAIDWDLVAAANSDIDNGIYLFDAVDQYTGTYRTYVNGIPVIGEMNKIPSMQGFFIHVPLVPGTASLDMDNGMRISDMTHVFMKKGRTKTSLNQNENRSLVRVTAGFSSSAISDPLVIYTDPLATRNFEGNLDALKLYNTTQAVPNFYSIGEDATQLAINSIPEDLIIPDIPLGIRTKVNNEVIFRMISNEGLFSTAKIYLYDALSGISADLTDTDYKIFLNAGNYDTRFYLRFENLTLEGENDYRISPLNIYSSGSTVFAHINCLEGKPGTLRILDLTGKTMFIKEVYENGYHEFNVDVLDGVYIVSFESGLFRFTMKLFIMSK